MDRTVSRRKRKRKGKDSLAMKTDTCDLPIAHRTAFVDQTLQLSVYLKGLTTMDIVVFVVDQKRLYSIVGYKDHFATYRLRINTTHA